MAQHEIDNVSGVSTTGHEWDGIEEASVYVVRVDSYESSPHSFIESVFTGETPDTQISIVLDESSENQHYQFSLRARNAEGVYVGKLIIIYENAIGWDYRFRVTDG